MPVSEGTNYMMRIFGSAAGARAHRNRFYCAALFLFLFATALYTFGQEATIVGTITDPSGAAVPGAAVVITDRETGQVHNFTTGSEGEYVAPDIHIGHYTVRVEAKGFKAVERRDLLLQVGDRARIDFQMQVGTTQETVTVEATAVAVQSDTSEISQVITGDQLAHLGTNGRSIYTFINLTPGSSSLQGDGQAPTPVGGDANVSFNGNRPVHNLYVLDGGEDADRGGGGTFAVMPSVESLAEFRTLTSNYDAEYGLSSAATMTTVIKSGSKAYHASLWEFFRNDDLDATNFFLTNKPELRYNIFGFNVGGPIDFWKKEHKSFFFYNMEWRRIVNGGSTHQLVPLGSEYPDASGTGTGAVFSATGNPIYVPSTVPPAVLFANCPGGVAPTGIVPGNAFPANTIPDCMIAANATALLGAGIFPKDNDAANPGYFTGGNNSPTNVREEIVRVDHSFNDKFAIFGHWVDESILQTFGTTMWSGDNVPTVGNTFGNPSYSGVIHLIHTIRPNLLNEVAFNYNGNRINIIPQGTPALAAPSGFTFNRVFTGPNLDSRIPTINLSNETGAQYSSNWTPWINKYDDYQLRDDISWTRGAHQLKMGASWALYKKSQDVFASTQGNFKFDGSFTSNAGAAHTGVDFADYLLGLTQQYQEDGVHDSGQWNNVSWGAYIQDNWRVNKKLTLNLGLRWDGVPHTYEANHRMSNFYPNLYDQSALPIFNPDGTISSTSPGLGTSPNPILAGYQFYVNGIGIDGLNGIPKGLVNNHWAAFGPRLGFAYDLTGQGKTVIRGGYGTMYERIQGNDMYNAGTNIPFSASVTLNSVLLANPNISAVTGAQVPPAPIVVSSITGVSSGSYKLPVSSQYSFSVEQALGAKAVLSVAYVGNTNRHQNDYREINLPDAGLLPCLTDSTTCTGAQPSYNQVVPYLGYHSIKLAFDEGNSHYNSLQTSLRGHVARDLELQVGYTLSKAMDPTTGGGNGFDLDPVSNPYAGWKYDMGPSVFDRRHVAFVSYIYDIPLFRTSSNGFAKSALGGWQLSGVVTLMSGAPLNITDSNPTVASIVPNTSVRPDLTGSISYPHKVGEWFDPSAFTDPAPGTWGNLGHDALRGPGRDNWNMTLFKNFTFSERARLEFRADAFNVWNHTQFIGNVQQGGIVTNLGASNFGQVTAAYDPRILQLGLKMVF